MDTQSRTSKREIAGWLAIWLSLGLLAAFLAVVMSAHRASAAGTKFVVEKRDYWSMNRSYAAPDNVGAGTHIETYKVSVASNYYFWPDAAGVNKIAVIGGSVCYQRLQGNGSLFQGVSANPYYFDDNDDVNPGATDVGDDGTDYDCKTFTVATSSRVWFRMSQSPGWKATGKVRKAFSNDDDFNFTWSGSTTKYFHPGDDPDVGDWKYIDGNYGGATH